MCLLVDRTNFESEPPPFVLYISDYRYNWCERLKSIMCRVQRGYVGLYSANIGTATAMSRNYCRG